MMTRTATGTASRPCPSADSDNPASLYLIKTGGLLARLLLMSLALLALCLLCNRPANAQGGDPHPVDPGHYWRIDKLLKGSSFSYDVLDVPYDGKKTTGTPVDGVIEGEDIANASASLTYTTTLKWIPAAGKDNTSDPPPSVVYIDEISQAEESPGMWNGPGAAASGAGTADDGLGDPPLPWNLGCISSGTSVLQKDGSSGTVKLDDVTVGAATPVSAWQQYPDYPGHYYWDWTGAEVELRFDVILDPDQHARSVTISRVGAHDETFDADGTGHGDTRFSYGAGSGLGAVTVQNTQVFHSTLLGTWTGPDWQWMPQGFSPEDTQDTHSQLIDVGSVMADGTPQQWEGQTDTAKPLTISYTATDLNDNFFATAKYILTAHDQYENWHRVSNQGGPIDPNAKGDAGGLTQLATGDNNVPGTIALTVPATPIEWNTDESAGGGFAAGAGAVCTMFGKIPTWGGVLLTLIGLTLQTAASVPPDATTVSPPDQFTASFLQTAFQNYNYNQTAYPGEENNSNLVDTNFAALLAHNPDFQGYYNGDYGTVSVTTTLSAQMLDYYFQADKYDNGGLLTHTSPGAATKPGGNVWQYLWHCAGAPHTPNQPPS